MAENVKTGKPVRPARPKKRRMFRIDLVTRRNLVGYVFVLPIILGLIIIFLPSMVNSFRFSLNDIIIRADGTGYDLAGKGFTNYITAFRADAEFPTRLFQTLRDMVINLPVILIFSFFMSILLNRKNFPGRTVFRTIFFLPVVIYSGIASAAGLTSGGATSEAAEMMAMLFSDPSLAGEGQSGMQSGFGYVMGLAMQLDQILMAMNLPQSLMNFVSLSVNRLQWIIQSSGVQILVFLAALQSIPTSVFEAAEVEGLTGWEMFWKITLPMVSPMILVNAIYTLVDTYSNSRYTIHEYIRSVSFSKGDYGYGSALSFIYFIFVIILIAIVTGMTSRFVFYND